MKYKVIKPSFYDFELNKAFNSNKIVELDAKLNRVKELVSLGLIEPLEEPKKSTRKKVSK